MDYDFSKPNVLEYLAPYREVTKVAIWAMRFQNL